MGGEYLLGQADDRRDVSQGISRYLSHIDFTTKYLLPFTNLHHYYDEEKGFIVWRHGTGDNTELLHIRSFFSGKGYGRCLVYSMLSSLEASPPYYSVFGFTRVGNEAAQKFYGAIGFNLLTIDGLYREGSAIMFWQGFKLLINKRDAYLKSTSTPITKG